MAVIWDRAVFTAEANHGIWGWAKTPGSILLDNTVLRTYWHIDLWTTYGSAGQYPVGNSLLRAGIIALPSGTDENTPGGIPSPISQGNSTWLDIKTLSPGIVIAQAATTAWQINWTSGEQDVKSMRRAVDLDLKLFLVWELQVGPGAVQDFVVAGWSGSVDMLLQLRP